MGRSFNFLKRLFQDTTDEVQLEGKTEKKEKIELKEVYDKEPRVVRRSFTNELGSYERIRTAVDGVELWRFRSKDSNVKEISMPASDFKTIKRFVNYIKEEIEKV